MRSSGTAVRETLIRKTHVDGEAVAAGITKMPVDDRTIAGETLEMPDGV